MLDALGNYFFINAIVTLVSICRFHNILKSLVLVFVGTVVVKKLPHGVVLVTAGLSFVEILAASVCFKEVVELVII